MIWAEGEQEKHNPEQWYSHDLVSIRMLLYYPDHELQHMGYFSSYISFYPVDWPWADWGQTLYSKPIFIKGGWHFPLCSRLAVVLLNLLWVFAMHHITGQGRFVTNSNTPYWSRAAKDRARMIDWLLQCLVFGASFMRPLCGYTSPGIFWFFFFSLCWLSLLVLQINLLIFHHMLWW